MAADNHERSKTSPTSIAGGTSGISTELDPLLLTSLATALVGCVGLGMVHPEPILPMAFVIGAVSVVALHAWRLQGWVRTSPRLSPNTISTNGRTAFMAELSGEVERARRYGRAVSAVLVRLPTDQEAGLGYLVSRIRSTDRVFTDSDGQVLVVLPETDGPAADAFLARAVHPDLPGVQAIRASFPCEGHTADGLASALFQRLHEPARPHDSEA